MDMTRQQALKEAGVIQGTYKNWLGKTPWDDAIQRRYGELVRYAWGHSNTPPRPRLDAREHRAPGGRAEAVSSPLSRYSLATKH